MSCRLLRHYLRKASETHRLHCPELTTDAEQLLTAYAWPGNVRELKNLAERLVVREWDRPIAPGDLPTEIRGSRETVVSAPSANVVFAQGSAPDGATAGAWLWSRRSTLGSVDRWRELLDRRPSALQGP